MNIFTYLKNKIGIVILMLSLLIASKSFAQTTLVAGDIAFSGYVANAGATPDQFSFVLLKAITSTTVIKFTDFGWRTGTNSFNSGAATESEMTFTATSALSAGQEITIDGVTATKSGGGSAGTLVHTTPGTPPFNATFSLASTGDQILAYQGSFAAPSFIAGMHMNVESSPATTAAAWDGTGAILSGQTSEKPAALTTGTNANWFTAEVNNARFICGSTPVNTVPLALAALNSGNVTPANWLKNSTNPPGFTLPTLCAYLSAMPVSLISFTGKRNNNVIALKWSTASETNNSYFDIERSQDANKFEMIGTLPRTWHDYNNSNLYI
ncbi:MAG: hypothetical protein IPO92_18655 [Saprospiraceae bacterium]|nr:hypothetical protein [Saprospiraceae bacterium]